MSIYDDLSALRLHYLQENLQHFLVQMDGIKATPKDTIHRAVELETIEKMNRSIKRRLSAAKLGKFKQMADFDYSWPQKNIKSEITELLSTEFVSNQMNIILAGPQGVGKTMIAKNLGLQAVMNGKTVFFTTASDLAIDLGSQESTAALQRRMRKYTSPDLLILDELGYLSYDSASADLLFEIIAKRYETNSIVLTTNMAFKDWPKVFSGAACVSALIDRLTHHCQIIKIEADSYRKAESAKSSKGAKP